MGKGSPTGAKAPGEIIPGPVRHLLGRGEFHPAKRAAGRQGAVAKQFWHVMTSHKIYQAPGLAISKINPYGENESESQGRCYFFSSFFIITDFSRGGNESRLPIDTLL
jgi:hypothetical protein